MLYTLSGYKCRLFYTCSLGLIICNDLDALIFILFWNLETVCERSGIEILGLFIVGGK